MLFSLFNLLLDVIILGHGNFLFEIIEHYQDVQSHRISQFDQNVQLKLNSFVICKHFK